MILQTYCSSDFFPSRMSQIKYDQEISDIFRSASILCERKSDMNQIYTFVPLSLSRQVEHSPIDLRCKSFKKQQWFCDYTGRQGLKPVDTWQGYSACKSTVCHRNKSVSIDISVGWEAVLRASFITIFLKE